MHIFENLLLRNCVSLNEEKEGPDGNEYPEDSKGAGLLPDLYPHGGSGGRSGREEADSGAGAEVLPVRLFARCGTCNSIPSSGLKVRAFTGLCSEALFWDTRSAAYETKTASQTRAGRTAGNSGKGKTLHFKRRVQENCEMYRLWRGSLAGPAGAALLGLPPSQDQRLAGQRATDARPGVNATRPGSARCVPCLLALLFHRHSRRRRRPRLQFHWT